MSAATLAERLAALRDATVGGPVDEREPPGVELFDAVLALVARRGRASDELDASLHEALARRLAWGEGERAILADARAVAEKLLDGGRRSCHGVDEELEVASAVAEAGAALGRVVTLAALARVASDKAGHLREELAQERLTAALERQRVELAELEAALAARQGR